MSGGSARFMSLKTTIAKLIGQKPKDRMTARLKPSASPVTMTDTATLMVTIIEKAISSQ